MKKAMALLPVLLIALSVVGFAYATWSDTVTIEGTVEMGELIVGILKDAYGANVDYLKNETTNGVLETSFIPPKPWVANATITLSEEETSTHHTPTQTVYKNMTVVVDNAYPQWDLEIEFTLKNAGTIPAAVDDWILTGEDVTDNEDLTFRFDRAEWDVDHWEIEIAVVDPVEGDIINIYIETWEPEDHQLEPCEEYIYRMDIDFKEAAEECHTYTFSFTWTFVQWNKAIND